MIISVWCENEDAVIPAPAGACPRAGGGEDRLQREPRLIMYRLTGGLYYWIPGQARYDNQLFFTISKYIPELK